MLRAKAVPTQCSTCTGEFGLGDRTLGWGIVLISDSGCEKKDVVLKAASGNGLAAQPGAFGRQGFSWRAAKFLQSQHCSGVVGQALGLCLWWLMGHQVPFHLSPRSGRECAHLGISYLLTAPWGTLEATSVLAETSALPKTYQEFW